MDVVLNKDTIFEKELMQMYLKNRKQLFSFILGPLLFFVIQALEIEHLSSQGQSVLAVTAWVAAWWITETVDLVVTSLLPIILLPLTGALTIGETTSSYGNPYIYLFLGGFIIGMAVEQWKLHKRIAFYIINWIGTDQKKVLLGIMLATAFLSMWISNTATAIMMLPIGLSMINHFKNDVNFSRSILLGIAYAASIGGIATLIGTPPNIILAGIAKENLGIEISFFGWMVFTLPLSSFLLWLTWNYLARRYPSESHETETKFELEKLEKMSVGERRVLIVLSFTAFMWITRTFIWNTWLPALDDTIIAITGAVLMLIIPSGKKKEPLMNWEQATKIPWNVLILFGAGLAIAKGFSTTDLTEWLGMYFNKLSFLPIMIVTIIILLSINFLTEITSNTATASILLPLLITLSVSLGIDTLPLLAGAALASSCAFMLPVATPPNAIIFSSGKIPIREMMRTGIRLNLISTLLIYLMITFVWNLVF